MKRRNSLPFLCFLFSAYSISFCKIPKHPKVLVFSKTAGYHHASIPNGIAAIQKIGREKGFAVDTTTNASFFNNEQLKQYAAVVFLSTTGNIFDTNQEAAFKQFINAGGGFIGIHAATDTEYEWNWYGQLVGGYFESHPETQKATLQVINNNHPATKDLPKQWTRIDEWYNFKNINPKLNVLLTIDESSYKGGRNGNNHPMAWHHEFDGGRVFYTALGHTEASYEEPLFLKHLTGGILYVLGQNL
jgi:type 1 glutamine amidotransferase